MDRFGLTINSMSLGGLAIAIGELVDDAIIDVENVVRRLRENATRPESERLPVLEVVYRASTEIRHSVVFATVIVALVFLPLFMLSSVEGRLLRPLGFGYVVALTASLVVALTVTPVLCSWLLPNSRLIASGTEPKLTQRLKAAYERWLGHAFTYWRTVLTAAVALLVAALVGIVAAGRSFLPEFNEGALTVSAVTIPGTSLADSNALGNALERLMLSVPEVTSTARRTGRAELDEHVQGVESAEIDVRLEMKDRPREAVLEELRQKVSLLPGTNVTIGQPISHRIDHMLSGTRANIAVKIFGDDLPTLRQLASQVQGQMSQVEGVVDLATEAQTDIPTLKVRVDPAAAARQGLASGTVAEALQTARVGHAVGQILQGQIAFPLVVRYALDDSTELDAIGMTQIQTPDRRQIPLSAVATIQEDRGPNFVMRENVQRRIVVQSNVSGRDLRSVVNDIQERVTQNVKLPQGYHVEYGGQFESEAQASRQLLWLSLGVVVAIFFILSAAFGSSRDGLLIMINLPLALIGGVVGVYLAGGVLSVASIVGFITLFGIATRNGIMLVSHIRHLQEQEGVTRFQDGRRSGRHRTARADPDDGARRRAGARPDRAVRRRAGQRDSGPDGDGDHVRPAELDGSQHGGGPDSVRAIRAPRHGARDGRLDVIGRRIAIHERPVLWRLRPVQPDVHRRRGRALARQCRHGRVRVARSGTPQSHVVVVSRRTVAVERGRLSRALLHADQSRSVVVRGLVRGPGRSLLVDHGW